eukprot:m.470880 g.470880  ORF g.470880 m.470880 type:complete len:1017 (+) comp30399_c0_seq1:244-3294(+)
MDAAAASAVGFTVTELWDAALERSPDAEAVCIAHGVLTITPDCTRRTYSELDRAASVVAAGVRGLCQGHARKRLVAVVADNGWSLVASLLGVLMAQCTYFPLGRFGDGTAPEHLVSLLRTAEDRCMLVLCDTQEAAAGLRRALQATALPHLVVCIDDFVATTAARAETAAETKQLERTDIVVHPDDICWAFLTSGTTSGVRKLVLARHREVASYIVSAGRRYGVSQHTRWFLGCSAGFDPNAGDTLMTLVGGGTVCCASWSDTLADISKCSAVTSANAAGSTPTVWSSFPTAAADGSEIKTLALGGEVMSVHVATTWAARASLWNTYGLTEAVVYQCAYRVPTDFSQLSDEQQRDELRRIGDPFESVSLRVVSVDFERGEIVLSGPQVAQHCCGRDGTIRTGDFVRHDHERLLLAGRCDNQVKIAGRRVNLEEIDTTVAHSAPTLVSAAISFQSHRCDAVVDAAIILAPEVRDDMQHQGWESLLSRSLIELGRARWPPYLLPSRVHVWESATFPLTETGKVNRVRVREVISARAAVAALPDRPLTPVECAVAQVWAEVHHVNLTVVTATMSLFELGADSLSALRCSRKLAELFDGPLDHSTFDGRAGEIRGVFAPRTILSNPVLEEYARLISSKPTVKDFAQRNGDDSDLVSERPPISVETEEDSPLDALMHRCIKCGSNRVASALLEASADVNGGIGRANRGMTPLHTAAQAGNVAVVTELLKRGASVTLTTEERVMPAHFAAAHSAESLVLLLKAGTPLRATDGNKQSLMHYAARGGRSDCIQVLAQAGLSRCLTDRWHRHPLSWAVLNGHADAVAALLAAGDCNVNFKIRPLQHAKRTNLAQEPPIHSAVRTGRMDIVRILLHHGAKVDLLDDDGKLPLHSAALYVPLELVNSPAMDTRAIENAFKPSMEITAALLSTARATCGRGVTDRYPPPLHFASMLGNVGVVKGLLDAGVAPDTKDQNDRTPDDYAATPSTEIQRLGQDPWPQYKVAKAYIRTLLFAALAETDSGADS